MLSIQCKKEYLDSLIEALPEFSGMLAGVYDYLHWTWGEDSKPPDAKEIEKTFLELIELAKEDSITNSFIETGGLRVDFNDIEISLSMGIDITLYFGETDASRDLYVLDRFKKAFGRHWRR